MPNCPICDIEKTPLTCHKSNSSSDGYDTYCKKCKEDKARERNKILKSRIRIINRRIRSRTKPGEPLCQITEEEYTQLLEAQDNSCAICGFKPQKHEKQLCVDHDHSTGKVRGLLCSSCNLGIGNFYDNSTRLRKAANYLRDSLQSSDSRSETEILQFDNESGGSMGNQNDGLLDCDYVQTRGQTHFSVIIR